MYENAENGEIIMYPEMENTDEADY